jgi:uncharacterized membrane protein YfcA
VGGAIRLAETFAVGIASGLLSGMFGIGGGVVTTPAIRLLLRAPALIAVGTPLAAIIPATVTGAVSYMRNGVADKRAGVLVGVSGALTAVAGAWATRLVGGTVVLLVTALVILLTAADMVLRVFRPQPDRPDAAASKQRPGPVPVLVAIGVLTGFYSGFLGLGGGFILIPMLTRWLRFPIKRAIGTSLVSITLLAVPALATHWYLGNIDWVIALALVVGVVPGAYLGSKITLGASDRTVNIGFAVLLVIVAIWLGVAEVARLGA